MPATQPLRGADLPHSFTIWLAAPSLSSGFVDFQHGRTGHTEGFANLPAPAGPMTAFHPSGPVPVPKARTMAGGINANLLFPISMATLNVGRVISPHPGPDRPAGRRRFPPLRPVPFYTVELDGCGG